MYFVKSQPVYYQYMAFYYQCDVVRMCDGAQGIGCACDLAVVFGGQRQLDVVDFGAVQTGGELVREDCQIEIGWCDQVDLWCICGV